ncbi:MAG: PDGLE domain-containing protein [Syntrophomonas sp.]
MFKQYKKLWLGLIVLVILCPLGLVATGTAFGEWSTEELIKEVGFIPQGLERLADTWSHAPMPDYAVPGMEGSFISSAGGYIISALVGIALVVGIITLFSKIVKE